MVTALITGVSGQDGSYLVELLLSKGYEVHGILRRSTQSERSWLDRLTSDPAIYGKTLFLHYGDLHDVTTIRRIAMKVQPDEVYHLAGQTHVGLSFDTAEMTCEFTAMVTLRLLEIIRDLPTAPRFLNVGSSEIFGRPDQSPQNEQTAMFPISPYGVAKAFGVQMVRVYREIHGLFACNAICYNHESPRRARSFVTRKITSAAARIALGSNEKLVLGNIDACRDWGFAGDYVEGMYRILQQPTADDFILATGQSTTVRDLLMIAFNAVGLNWEEHVTIDQKLFRPADSQVLLGDPAKALERLGWTSRTTIQQLIRNMVEADLAEYRSKGLR